MGSLDHHAPMDDYAPMDDRVPMDIAAYERRSRAGRCFICAFLAGEPGYEHERLYEDKAHVAFLSRYPTVVGYALVAPRRHVEDVIGDLDLDGYLSLQAAVHKVARAVNVHVSDAADRIATGSH